MSSATNTDNIGPSREPYSNLGPDNVNDSPTPGRLDTHSVTPGEGGIAHASPTGNADTSEGLDIDAEWCKLDSQAEECANQLVDDLRYCLGISKPDAVEQVSKGVRKLLKKQLKRIKMMHSAQQRRAMIRRFYRLLQDVGSVESQVRCHARYAFRRLHKDWTEERRVERARTAPLHELLIALGYDQQAIRRCDEHRRMTCETEARGVLIRMGFQYADAESYLHRLQDERPDEYLFLLDELIAMERTSQSPAHARVGRLVAQNAIDALANELNELFALRSEARQKLRQAGWTDQEIAWQLGQCSRAGLDAIVSQPGSPQRPSAPPMGEENWSLGSVPNDSRAQPEDSGTTSFS